MFLFIKLEMFNKLLYVDSKRGLMEIDEDKDIAMIVVSDKPGKYKYGPAKEERKIDLVYQLPFPADFGCERMFDIIECRLMKNNQFNQKLLAANYSVINRIIGSFDPLIKFGGVIIVHLQGPLVDQAALGDFTKALETYNYLLDEQQSRQEKKMILFKTGQKKSQV